VVDLRDKKEEGGEKRKKKPQEDFRILLTPKTGPTRNTLDHSEKVERGQGKKHNKSKGETTEEKKSLDHPGKHQTKRNESQLISAQPETSPFILAQNFLPHIGADCSKGRRRVEKGKRKTERG